MALYVRDGSYTCEDSIDYRFVGSLCCTPETNVTLCVNYTSILKTHSRVEFRKKYCNHEILRICFIPLFPMTIGDDR